MNQPIANDDPMHVPAVPNGPTCQHIFMKAGDGRFRWLEIRGVAFSGKEMLVTDARTVAGQGKPTPNRTRPARLRVVS